MASHRSACSLWSLRDPGLPYEISVTHQVRVPGLIVHRVGRLSASDIRRIDGVPTTSPTRTLIDVASVLGPEELEEILDEALARRMVTVKNLQRRIESLGRRGRKGTGLLWQLLCERVAAPRLPQSRFETRLLRMLTARGLPKPRCQFEVRLLSGRRAYLDFAYPEAMLAIEADSYWHHSSLSDWSNDRVRNNELVAAGWRVLPITHQDLMGDPALIVELLTRSLSGVEVGDFRRPMAGKLNKRQAERGLR